MRRILSILPRHDGDAPLETAVPPHAERPVAAPRTNKRRRSGRRRAVHLAAVVVAIAALGAACDFAPVPSPGPGSTRAASFSTPPGTPPLGHWLALAQCETGGNWAAPGPTFVGGLGMWAGNWAAHGGLQYAPSANLATPAQQIAVATNLWLAGGTWGCRVGDGWDHR